MWVGDRPNDDDGAGLANRDLENLRGDSLGTCLDCSAGKFDCTTRRPVEIKSSSPDKHNSGLDGDGHKCPPKRIRGSGTAALGIVYLISGSGEGISKGFSGRSSRIGEPGSR